MFTLYDDFFGCLVVVCHDGSINNRLLIRYQNYTSRSDEATVLELIIATNTDVNTTF